jgi:hypothetical protein
MNDSHETTPQPPRQENSQVPGPDAVTSLLQSDAVILMLAGRALADGQDRPEALAAARRVLDAEMRALLPWPAGPDYARAAARYESLGRPGDAALLRRIAETDDLLADLARRWNTRYDDRPASPAQRLLATLHEGGFLDYHGDPLQGADGALYRPASYESPAGPMPALVISGRGGSELVLDWASDGSVYDWVATRGAAAAQHLTGPPVPGECRAWQEDQVLARLVTHPREAESLTGRLPADTFTTDVRYDVYQAVRVLAGLGRYYETQDVANVLATRVAAQPEYAMPAYKSAGGPFAYLSRLAVTDVRREQAASTAASLTEEDKQNRVLAANGPLAPQARPSAQAPARHQGTQAAPATQPASTRPGAAQPVLQRPAPPGPSGTSPGPRLLRPPSQESASVPSAVR